SNVRAAVLKQLAEKPSPNVVPKIAEFVAAEADVDLVVHAVRVLRSAGGDAAVEQLKGLLKHASWRVRAEAVEAIAESLDDRYGSKKIRSDLVNACRVAMRGSLADVDGFVVGRAVGALKKSGELGNIDALVQAAAAHPELAVEVVAALSYGSAIRARSIEHLRQFARHPDPAVRAKAIQALSESANEAAVAPLQAGLGD